MNGTMTGGRRVLPSFVLRSGVLALTWVILAGGDAGSLALGVPVAMVAAFVSVLLSPPRPSGFRLAGVFPYAVYFVTQSVIGGFDVARRALSPAMPIDPALIEYPLRLAGAAPRMIFANTISLLPGTLSARYIDGTLQVHALDATASVEAELRVLEAKVTALFGEHLTEGGRG